MKNVNASCNINEQDWKVLIKIYHEAEITYVQDLFKQ